MKTVCMLLLAIAIFLCAGCMSTALTTARPAEEDEKRTKVNIGYNIQKSDDFDFDYLNLYPILSFSWIKAFPQLDMELEVINSHYGIIPNGIAVKKMIMEEPFPLSIRSHTQLLFLLESMNFPFFGLMFNQSGELLANVIEGDQCTIYISGGYTYTGRITNQLPYEVKYSDIHSIRGTIGCELFSRYVFDIGLVHNIPVSGNPPQILPLIGFSW